MATTTILALCLAAFSGGGDGNANRKGQYRGPFEDLVVPFPSTPGGLPSLPTDPLSAGDGFAGLEGYNRWEFWFELQKDLLLRSRDFRRREILPATPPAEPPTDDGRVRTQDARGPIAQALRAALKSSDERVVRAAALGLGRIGNKSAIDDLEALAGRGDVATRRYAALALGMLEDRTVLSKLFNLIVDAQTPTEVRAAALLGIGFQGRREGSRFLRDYLEKGLTPETAGGNEGELLTATVLALGMCRDRDTSPLLIARYRALREVKTSKTKPMELAILHALGRIGDPSAQLVLLEALQEKDIERRRAAALALGDLGDRSVVKPLVTALEEDNDDQTRGFAAISLGRLGGEAARDALRAAFTNKGSRTVKTYAAIGIGLLGDRAFAPELLKALQQPSEESQRGAFAIALGLLEEPKVAEPLLKIVEQRSSATRLRGYAAIALGLLKAEGTLERLIKVLEEDPDKVDVWRRALLLGIGAYGQAKAGPAIARVLASDSREMVREHAALALNLCRARSEIETLAKMLEKEQYRGDLALFCVSALSGLGDRYEYPLVSESFFNFNYRFRNTFLEELEYVL